jgi:hypothetical protein
MFPLLPFFFVSFVFPDHIPLIFPNSAVDVTEGSSCLRLDDDYFSSSVHLILPSVTHSDFGCLTKPKGL